MQKISGLKIITVIACATLAACSPPNRQAISKCENDAVAKSRGLSLESSDVGELVEACMISQGYALKEDGLRCANDMRTATNPGCYYRDDVIGRLIARFSKD